MDLRRRLAEIQARQREIRELIEGGGECDVPALTIEARSLATEKADVEARLAALGELQNGDGGDGTPPQTRSLTNPILEAAQARGAGESGGSGDTPPVGRFGSVEYRNAFMRHVLRGERIPDQYRANQTTATGDIGAVIPDTVVNTIIEKMESTGMILARVTRTAHKGGVRIPTSGVKPVATWVAEGAGSDKQKKSTGEITFTYHKLRCAVAVSLEVDTIALPIFEGTLINNVVEAMTKALESAIVSGDGAGKPKGIIVEPPVSGQALVANALSYGLLVKAEAALPQAYESGAEWCMSKTTYMQFFGLTDSDGQPIGRVNYGIAGAPERFLLGRPVVVCDYVDTFGASLANNKVFAFLFNFKDYVLNTNLSMTVKKYEDNDTDDQVTKAIMLVDGKVVQNGSLVTIAKGTAPA